MTRRSIIFAVYCIQRQARAAHRRSVFAENGKPREGKSGMAHRPQEPSPQGERKDTGGERMHLPNRCQFTAETAPFLQTKRPI